MEHVYTRKGKLRERDWVLRVQVTKSHKLIDATWLYVERVVLVAKNDPVYNSEFPYQAVQARELRHCPQPPFRIDKAFRQALKALSGEMSEKAVYAQVSSKPPTPGFLKKLRERIST